LSGYPLANVSQVMPFLQAPIWKPERERRMFACHFLQMQSL